METRLLPSSIPAALVRPFRALVVDWHGGGGEVRHDEADALRARLDRLLSVGVPVVIVSAVSWAQLTRRLAAPLDRGRRAGLFLAPECGAEVWGFSPGGGPSRLSRLVDEPDAEGLARRAALLDWVARALAEPRNIPLEDVLVVGETPAELLALKARVPGADRATFVALADEDGARGEGARGEGARGEGECGDGEGGVGRVLALGGGLARLDELLSVQASLHPFEIPLVPTSDEAWLLTEHGAALTREHEIESLQALGNGYLGSRASLAEGSPLSLPGTFLAGVYERRPEQVPDPELAHGFEWERIAGFVDGRPVRVDTVETLEHRRTLDLYQGVLWREWRFRDALGRVTTIRGVRFASLADRHALVQSVELVPENYSARLCFETPLRAPRIWYGRDDGAFVLSRTTRGTDVDIAFAFLSHTESEEGDPIRREVESEAEEGEVRLVERMEIDVEMGRGYRFDRFVSVYTSRDTPDPVGEASAHAMSLRDDGILGVVGPHVEAWRRRWARADVVIEGDPEAQRALRFAIYHLLIAANPDDERASVGARGLTGESYEGHVFWDTEIFMLPFLLHTEPEAARALLAYRFHTLPAARARAARLGYRGALYAWESADTGDDVTPKVIVTPEGLVLPVLAGEQEHHISADVAYGVWRYLEATGDEAFLLEMGAEILLETARFWASRGQAGEDRRYHIKKVIGPDEYHDSVDDNAFTNAMAQWNLETGVRVARRLADAHATRWAALSSKLGLGEDEIRRWASLAEVMYLGRSPTSDVIEQFRDYFDLEDIDLAALEPRTAPVDVLLGPERVQRSQLLKQADVVMLLWLLEDRFPRKVREASYRYYEPRTGHGSSLSPSMYALVAARLGDVETAYRYFQQAAAIDLANNMGNAAGGVHLAACGGLWQAAVHGFAGLTFTERGPVLAPRLPAGWRRMRFPVRWRGRVYDIDTDRPGPQVPREE